MISGVGLTALGIAAARAAESRRQDRLFDDPYADAFLAAGNEGDLIPARPSAESVAVWQSMGDYMALRTRCFDDFLTGAAGDGCGQVVLLGAGLDMRAFRLSWPQAVRLFELDTPQVHFFKDAVMAGKGWHPRCDRVAVPTDLRDDWVAALRAAGFIAESPTAWLAEGLLRYLGDADTVRLLDAVTKLSHTGSRLAVELTGLSMLRSANMLSALGELDRSTAEEQKALWAASSGDRQADHELLLAAHGWQTRSRTVADLATQYGRPVPPAFDPDRAGSDAGRLVTACRP